MCEIAKILVSLPFSPAEYVQDKASVMERARKLYEEITGDKSELVLSEIEEELELLFHDRKALSVEDVNMPEHLRSGCWLGIVIDGNLIYGLVQVSPKIISVEYEGHRGCSQLELLAPVVWTEYPDEEANREGKLKAVELLTDLFYSSLT